MQAAVEAPEGALQVLFPMIPDVDAWRTRMDQMKRCNESLKEKGLPFCGNCPLVLDRNPRRCLMAGDIDAGADFLAVDLDDWCSIPVVFPGGKSPPPPITLPCCVWCRM